MGIEAFKKFPAQGLLVGEILASYTDLEFGLMLCVDALRNDFDTVLKAMYRSRGEKQRIDIADALGRLKYKGIGLENEFSMLIGAMHFCKKIRNQYSHCVWATFTGHLSFADLEGVAKANTDAKDLKHLTFHRVSEELLRSQDDYFRYTNHLMNWLKAEALLLTNVEKENPVPVIKQPQQPNLYID